MSRDSTRLSSREQVAAEDALPTGPPPAAWRTSSTGKKFRIDPGVALPERSSPLRVQEPTSSPKPSTSSEFLTGDTLEKFVAKYGQNYDSYQATEPGRLTFWSRRGLGLISYVRRGQHVLVGGGLIAPEEHKETLLREFVEQSERDKLHVAYLNIGERDRPLFEKLGFHITKWGEEPLVDLEGLSWSGKAYEWVRRQTNYCQRNGVVMSEVRQRDLEPQEFARIMAEVREVAAESLSLKAHPAGMKFLEGNIETHDLELRRLFIARSAQGQGRIEGFVVCNPVRNGAAWATEMYRHRLDSVRGTVAFLFHQLMEQMRQEGVEQVGLCLDPGRGCQSAESGESWLIRRGWGFAENYLGFLFDFAGIRHFKSRFRPHYESRYVCGKTPPTVPFMWMFLSSLGCLQFSCKNIIRIGLERVRKRAVRKTLVSD